MTKRLIPNPENVRSVAVLRFGGLGDYLLLMPLLEDLRAYYKNSVITVIAGPSGAELLGTCPAVDKLVILPQISKQGWESVLSPAAVAELFRISRNLPYPLDIFIDAVSKYSLAGSMKPLLCRLLANPRFSAGLDYRRRAFLCNLRIPEDRHKHKHLIERYAELARALGCDAKFHLPELPLPQEALSAAKDFFAPHQRVPKIGMHPGANAKFLQDRAWPVERFASLAERIMQKMPNAKIFLTGARHEESLLADLARRISPCPLILPFQESILSFVAYLRSLDFYISNDTGPMHLAVASGVPTLGIFGHADFETYGSYPADLPFVGVTLCKNEAKPGPAPRGSDPRGLLEISVEEVYGAFEKLRGMRKGAAA